MYFTGVTNTLERVSPRVIVLNPPEKLVIETTSSGGYQHYDWSRNGNPFGSAGFPVTLQEFPNFIEIFVREPTTMDDLGVYDVDLTISAGQTQTPVVQFIVTRYGKNHNTSIYHMTLIFYFRTPVLIESVICYWQNIGNIIISDRTSAPPPMLCMLPSPLQTITRMCKHAGMTHARCK